MRARLLTGIVVAGLAVVAALSPMETKAQTETIALRAITPWTPEYPSSQPIFMFQRLVNEKLGDRVQITYLGGPEVVPAAEQFEALRNGVVDVIIGAAAYYTAQVPEASAMLLARKSPQELRQSGYHDAMAELHLEKGGVIFLANLTGVPDTGFRIYLNKRIDSADLTGLSIRVSPVYVPLVNGLGGTPINMPVTDIYTALERGVVDGYGQTYIGIMDLGLQEVTNYVVDVPFYSKDNGLLMNADVWNDLPEDVRQGLEEVAVELENEITQYQSEMIEEENKRLRDIGIEFIELGEEDKEKWLRAAYETRWEEFTEQSPEWAPRLRELGG
jgi:TRAP-type transport system periplasmic protein